MQNYSYDNGGTALASMTSAIMKRVYFKMTLGLLATAFTAVYCASSSPTHG